MAAAIVKANKGGNIMGLSVRYQITRREWRTHDAQHPRGSGYCLDQGQYMALIKEWRLFGHKVWSWQIDREDIPSHVWIRALCLGGDPDEWRTRLKIPAGVA